MHTAHARVKGGSNSATLLFLGEKIQIPLKAGHHPFKWRFADVTFNAGLVALRIMRISGDTDQFCYETLYFCYFSGGGGGGGGGESPIPTLDPRMQRIFKSVCAPTHSH